MEKESYDILKVKEYFLYYIFNGDEKDVNKHINTSWIIPRFSYYFGILLTVGLIGFGGFILWRWYLEVGIFHLIFWIFAIYPFAVLFGAYKVFMKNWAMRNYLQLEKYFSIKSSLPPFLEKFQKSVHKDISNDGIDPIEIAGITQNMRNIYSIMKLISGPLTEFRKVGVHLPDEAREVLERFIVIEHTWINEYISEFRETLMIWIEVHKSELSEYQRKELLEENQEIYSLASSRLSNHIENLEKVRV